MQIKMFHVKHVMEKEWWMSWKTVPTVMEQVKLLFAMIVENVLTLIRITVMNVLKSKKKRK